MTADRSPNSSARQARGSGGAPIDPGVARDLSELARELEAQSDTASVMQRVVDAAVHEVNGATGAAITLLSEGRITSPAHSDDRARQVGEAQEETREGPCVDTSREEVTLRSDDLKNDPRWPTWGAAAVEQGVRSALSFQLFVERDSMGALDIYGDEVDVFDAESENTGLLLASHAAVAMSGTRKIDSMHVALRSRDVIGQAKGILMERLKIDADQAFDLLAYVSQQEHRKLRDIAESLASTGELPPVRPQSEV